MTPITKYAAIAVGMVALVACQADQSGTEIFDVTDPTSQDGAGEPTAGGTGTGGESASGAEAPHGDGVSVVEPASFDEERSSPNVGGSQGSDPTLEDINSVFTGEPVVYGTDRNAGADFASADLSDSERTAVFAAYDEFLAGADAVRLQGDEGDPVLAATGLVDDRLADHEAELDADFGVIQDMASFANIEHVRGSAANWVVIEDCLEVSTTTSISVVSSDFVRQDVWLEPDDDGWTVTAVDVIHDGSLQAADSPGCVPRRYAEHAESVTSEFIRLESAGPAVDLGALAVVTTAEFFDIVTAEPPSDAASSAEPVVAMLGHSTLDGTRTLFLEACAETADGFSFRQYEVTRGLLDGFPDFGDGQDVYAVSDRSPAEPVDVCPVGSGS